MVLESCEGWRQIFGLLEILISWLSVVLRRLSYAGSGLELLVWCLAEAGLS